MSSIEPIGHSSPQRPPEGVQLNLYTAALREIEADVQNYDTTGDDINKLNDLLGQLANESGNSKIDSAITALTDAKNLLLAKAPMNDVMHKLEDAWALLKDL